MRRVPPLTALVLAVSSIVTACGGGEEHEQPSEPPAELLAGAVANPARSGDSEIELDLALEGSSLLAGTTTVDAEGPFALEQAGGLPSFDLTVDAEVAGFGLDLDLVSTGDDAFLVFFGENYRVGPELVAEASAALGSAQGPGGGLGLDVASWFRNPGYAGSESVAGTDTERIEGTLDSDAAAADLADLAGGIGAPPLVGALASGAESGPIEAWVAYDDKTIRRLRVQFPFTVPPAQQAHAGGISGGAVTLDAEISDVGAEVTVEPPEGGGFQPIEQLIDRLQDLASFGGI
ncbi:MAG: hypothetical protein M3O25_11795 [Actinomycetota bacterium]|nr:hypothetical protein [Actinomycetota bacterium]